MQIANKPNVAYFCPGYVTEPLTWIAMETISRENEDTNYATFGETFAGSYF